jgi:hypothetical protein
VVIRRAQGIGHMFNMVNQDGQVLFVDGQIGYVGTEPYPYDGTITSTRFIITNDPMD